MSGTGRPATNFHLSSVHAALFAKKLESVRSLADLEKVWNAHGPWLIGRDRERVIAMCRRKKTELGE